MQNNIIGLLKGIIQLNRVIRNFNEVGIDSDDLNEALDQLTDSFLDHLGFHKDTTVETANEDGALNPDHPDYYCRDYLYDLIWDCYTPSRSEYIYNKLLEELE